MVEQRFCKPKVAGSIPASGTRISGKRVYPQVYAPFCPRISLARPVLGLANRRASCFNDQVDAVFGSKRRGLRIGMQRNRDQNHGAPDTSVSGAYLVLGSVTGVQLAASHRPKAPAATPPPPIFPRSAPEPPTPCLVAPADTAADDRLFVPHPIAIARCYSNRRITAAKICERR